MTEPLVIDGWKCEAWDGYRCAERNGYRVSADGGGLDWHEQSSGYSGASGSGGIPQSVLAWLIRPMLHEAWEHGRTASPHNANINPHKDP